MEKLGNYEKTYRLVREGLETARRLRPSAGTSSESIRIMAPDHQAYFPALLNAYQKLEREATTPRQKREVKRIKEILNTELRIAGLPDLDKIAT